MTWLRPRKQNTSQVLSKIMFSYQKVQKLLLVIIAKSLPNQSCFPSKNRFIIYKNKKSTIIIC